MGQSLFLIVVFVGVLALFPLAIRWLQKRGTLPASLGGGMTSATSRVVSSVAVGPQQRVVTVEVGPEQARVWLVLGVTAQSIQCLHTLPAGASAPLPTAATPAPSFAAIAQELRHD